MRPRKGEDSLSFASVYDTLYDDPTFLAARTDFLLAALAPSDAPLLDAGCGTGSQAAALRDRSRRVIALDLDPLMLAVAKKKRGGLPLARGDLRRLPFRAAFGGIFCLESPLAYLLDDGDFILALRGLRRALLPRGRLVIDTFDFPATLGAGRMRPREATFGEVRVSESHSYDAETRIWTMRQRFAVGKREEARRFEVKHRLKIRPADAYAAALEETGFGILEMLPGYPGTPDRRIIVVARAT
jgi:SAM-dependent methyltransferase